MHLFYQAVGRAPFMHMFGAGRMMCKATLCIEMSISKDDIKVKLVPVLMWLLCSLQGWNNHQKSLQNQVSGVIP